MDPSFLASIAAIGTLLLAVASAVFARKQWLHKTGHWLYIPAPNVLSQDPSCPDFWVFPPTETDAGVYSVVIAGTLINAGPSDAFSVRIYAEPEVDLEQVGKSLEAAIDVVARHPKTQKKRSEIRSSFFESYKNRKSFLPVLPVGEKQQFVVIARFDKGHPYLESILQEDGAGEDISCFWEHEGNQAHRVHAASRTILGRRLRFGPADLCAPFERQPAITPKG